MHQRAYRDNRVKYPVLLDLDDECLLVRLRCCGGIMTLYQDNTMWSFTLGLVLYYWPSLTYEAYYLVVSSP